MENHGGKREGAGRPKGKLNEATLLLKDKLEPHIDMAVDILVEAAQDGDVSCAKDILDRYYGKPRQALELDHKEAYKPRTLADFYSDEGDENH